MKDVLSKWKEYSIEILNKIQLIENVKIDEINFLSLKTIYDFEKQKNNWYEIRTSYFCHLIKIFLDIDLNITWYICKNMKMTDPNFEKKVEMIKAWKIPK